MNDPNNSTKAKTSYVNTLISDRDMVTSVNATPLLPPSESCRYTLTPKHLVTKGGG